jgi:hypothetical protein
MQCGVERGRMSKEEARTKLGPRVVCASLSFAILLNPNTPEFSFERNLLYVCTQKSWLGAFPLPK